MYKIPTFLEILENVKTHMLINKPKKNEATNTEHKRYRKNLKKIKKLIKHEKKGEKNHGK